MGNQSVCLSCIFLACTSQTGAHDFALSGRTQYILTSYSAALPSVVPPHSVSLLLLQFEKQHVKSNFNRDNGKIEMEYFKGGRTNIAYNCLDRHIKEGRGDQPCFLWEGNELDQSCCMTYKQVLDEVSRLVSSDMYHYMRHLLCAVTDNLVSEGPVPLSPVTDNF